MPCAGERSRHSSTTDLDSVALAGRVEDWVTGNLASAFHDPGASVEDWHDQIAASASRKIAMPFPSARSAAASTSSRGWTRVGVTRRRGITLARLRSRTLLKPVEIREVAEEIEDLIEAGHHRIALDFEAVERLSIAFVPAMVEASRRCAAFPDGLLKVYRLRPELTELVTFAAGRESLAIVPEDASALEGDWPERPDMSPLPDAVILALRNAKAEGPGRAAASGDENAFSTCAAQHLQPSDQPRLVFRCGPFQGRALQIDEEGFSIGRDGLCRVPLDDPSVSRRHATIRCREGRILIRDLASRNGTLVNHQRIQGQEIEIHHGDRIEIGRHVFSFERGATSSVKTSPGEDEILGWLNPDAAESCGRLDEQAAWDDLETAPGSLRLDVIEDTLVATPLDTQLIDSTSLEPLREGLGATLERPLPRRVIFNLEHVVRITGAAVGLLVAHQLKLDRLGGGLRLCQAQPRVKAVLDQVRVPLLMDVYPRVEDAVLASW